MKQKKVKKLLTKLVKYSGLDLCNYCETIGINKLYCDCCTDKECASNILKYFIKSEEEKKYVRENTENS